MGPEKFVDTSGFFALLVKKDESHEKAVSIFQSAGLEKTSFLTTDYVLDETATLFKARGLSHLLPGFFEKIFASRACRIEYVDRDRFDRTQAFFLKRMEYPWSFTDCFSFVMMKESGLHSAVTKDTHFKAAGFQALLTS